MPAPMLQVIYVSSAVGMFSREDLVTLLTKSRGANTERGITGMLLYLDGNFLQTIEGDPHMVQTLHRTIARDPRHRGMLTLVTRHVTTRAFADWSMGFKGPEDLGAEERSAFSTLTHLLATPGMSVTDDRVVNSVLKTFLVNNQR